MEYGPYHGLASYNTVAFKLKKDNLTYYMQLKF